ncbi:hypothetical protein HOE22_01710 [Candidatus Woesearchaeota archaeon]|jgi:hypothetical protein|nr:hypothetical protein [Candidatus Woesearchaeota archaeon]
MKKIKSLFGNTNIKKINEVEKRKAVASLKKWLKDSSDQNTKTILRGNKEYSLNDVAKEIDKGSKIGNELIESWIDLRIKI